MGTLIEDTVLRDKIHVFQDRLEAGKLLSKRLLEYKGPESIVLAIPSGGVPVAAQVALVLDLPLDLIIVRKIQIPYNPEAGFGAVTPDGEVIINEDLLYRLGLADEEVKAQTEKALKIIKKRDKLFRSEKPFPPMKGRRIIVIDDGLASGYTMLAAVKFIRSMAPASIIAAVPTGSKRTVDFILPAVDRLLCLNVRSGYPFAVADAYINWYDITDEEVLELMVRRPREGS